ncbi:MAG TPA: hypothetical protein VLL98_02315 [Rickettsiales bacterium]|nr:hypothetical protein [Rickettsiales bacterium]
MLTQQVFLGEFLIISIFFIFAILFFVFNSDCNYEDEELEENEYSLSKITLLVIAFFVIFSIIGVNFYKIDKSENQLITKNFAIQNDLNDQDLNNKHLQSYNNYMENIALLNQNKIFQKLTHIIIFYIGIIILLYFFNRRREENER